MADEESANMVVRVITDFLGPAARETGELVADQIRYLRWKNSVRLVERAKSYAAEKGLKTSTVPLKFLIPFFEKASVEDEDNPLFERWARLLANAADQYSDRYVTYLTILSSLNFHEACLLEQMWKTASARTVFSIDEARPFAEFEDDEFQARLGVATGKSISEKDLEIPGGVAFLFHEDDIPNANEFNLYGFDPYPDLLHLQSLGLVSVNLSSLLAGGKRHFVLYAKISAFGYQFVEACEGPAGG